MMNLMGNERNRELRRRETMELRRRVWSIATTAIVLAALMVLLTKLAGC